MSAHQKLRDQGRSTLATLTVSIRLTEPISIYTSIFPHLVRVCGTLYRDFFQPLYKERIMRTDHSETVQAQFDSQAQAYLRSAVHAAGPDLLRASELISQ